MAKIWLHGILVFFVAGKLLQMDDGSDVSDEDVGVRVFYTIDVQLVDFVLLRQRKVFRFLNQFRRLDVWLGE